MKIGEPHAKRNHQPETAPAAIKILAARNHQPPRVPIPPGQTFWAITAGYARIQRQSAVCRGGDMAVDFANGGSMTIREGEMAVEPKSVSHRPRSETAARW